MRLALFNLALVAVILLGLAALAVKTVLQAIL